MMPNSSINGLIRKITLVILFIISITSFLYSQTIYISESFNLHRLNLEQCTYDLVVTVDRQMSDITFLPDGTLIGINLSRELFEVDTITGLTTLLYTFPGLLFGSLASSLDGLIYTTDRNGELWSFNKSTGTATNLGNVGFGNGGDLAFFNGELYMSVVSEDLIVRIDIDDPPNSSIVMTDAGSSGGGMYGIVTFALDCNDIQFYGIVSGTFTILRVDLESLTTEVVCTLDQLFAGAATTREFKASDPVRVLDTLIAHPGCSEDNGTITVHAGGGIPPYEYSINNSPLQSQNIFENLNPGVHEIVVIDTRGCSTEIDVTLALQDIDLIDSIVITDATCNLNNGQAEIITAGSGTFEYSLDGISYQSSGLFDGLAPGIYDVFVINSEGCEENITAEIASVPAVTITDLQIIPTSCGASNGSVEIQVQGGSGIAYSIDGMIFQDENKFEDLGTGQIIITVVDENNCMVDSMINILSSISLGVDSVIIANPVCEEITGSVLISISNANGEIAFSLDGLESQTSPLFSGINIGPHQWVAIDEAGCTVAGEFEIDQIPSLQLIAVMTKLAGCNSSNGEVEFELNDVTEKIYIKLNDQLFTETHITGLSASYYNVEIEDDNGCIIDTFILVGSKPCGIFIPNIFSPNGDGVNDELIIELLSATSVIQFNIFDRWGTVVFSSTDIPSGQASIKWDGILHGQLLNPGVYVYLMELDDTAEKRFIAGEVTLIR